MRVVDATLNVPSGLVDCTPIARRMFDWMYAQRDEFLLTALKRRGENAKLSHVSGSTSRADIETTIS